MSGNPKCPRCGKTVYFAERNTFEGQDYHQLCLVAKHKEDGSIHNKGWYGTTPQDKAVVLGQGAPPPQSGGSGGALCSQCGTAGKPGAKFCANCGSKL